MAPVAVLYFSPVDYGYMSLVNSVAQFCSILGLLGITDQGLPRFYLGADNESDKKEYVSSAYYVSFYGLTIVLIGIFSLLPFVQNIFGEVGKPHIFVALLALTYLGQCLFSVGTNMLKWSFKSFMFMKVVMLQAITCSIVNIAGIVFLGWGVRPVVLVSALGTLLAGIFSNVINKDQIGLSFVNRAKIKELLLYSWPLLGLNVFAFFTRSFDRVFLAKYDSLSSVGVYSVSFLVANLFGALISGLLFAWGPHLFSTYKEDWAPKQYANIFGFVTVVSVINIAVLGLWGEPLIALLRPDGIYDQIGVLIPWLVAAMALYYLGGYFSPGPDIAKKTHLKFIAFVCGGITNVILNFIMVPRYGCIGAAMASAAASLIAAVCIQVVSNRYYYVPNRWKMSFLYIIVVTVIVSAVQNRALALYPGELSIMLRIVLTVALSVFAVLLFWSELVRSGLITRSFSMLINLK
ncbi:MAG: polysaccharide biosynthesis protein [Candidatus Omnitrophica bacterium]|nr:polysaccharide biosynthesis protein [Candidatus Omnitrophota bacterium]